jgi:hypothetical protein
LRSLSIKELAEVVRNEGDRVTALMLSRTTRTNEPTRCAALLGFGASAALCLCPDRHGRDYGAARTRRHLRNAPARRFFAAP